VAVRVDREQRHAAVARLRELRAVGDLTAGHVELAAAGLGVSDRTVWRWLGSPTGERAARPGQPAYRLSEADRAGYAHFRGNVAAVHRARCAVLDAGHNPQLLGQEVLGADDERPVVLAAGVPVPQFLVLGWAGAIAVSCRTLQESYVREMTPAERSGWSRGEDARRATQVYLRRPPVGRNHTWEMDHKLLPILVRPPRGPSVRPWLTSAIDDGTRALVGWAIALTPHTGTVLTAIRMGMVLDPARGPFGAVPELVRIDRGLEFAATAVTDALAALSVQTDRLPAFQPHRKGKIERVHRSIEQTLLCGLPGFTGGPRDAAGTLYGPVDDRVRARERAQDELVGPLPIARFAGLFAAWARWYNLERPHSMLAGRTPAQAWAEDPGPVHRVDADKLRHLLLAADEATIGKYGIRRHKLDYVAPELQGRGGDKVQIRFMPHDDRSIEVYRGGEFLCTAYPRDRLTAEQTTAFLAHAASERKRHGRERRAATARARSTLVPLTDGTTTAEESRVLPAGAGDGLAARRGDERMRRRARSHLLGLTDPTPPDPEQRPGPPDTAAFSAVEDEEQG
jgi:putative transposase